LFLLFIQRALSLFAGALHRVRLVAEDVDALGLFLHLSELLVGLRLPVFELAQPRLEVVKQVQRLVRDRGRLLSG